MFISSRLSQPPSGGESAYARRVRLQRMESEHSRAMYGWNHPANLGWAARRDDLRKTCCCVIVVSAPELRAHAPVVRMAARPSAPAPSPAAPVAGLATHSTASVPASIMMEVRR